MSSYNIKYNTNDLSSELIDRFISSSAFWSIVKSKQLDPEDVTSIDVVFLAKGLEKRLYKVRIARNQKRHFDCKIAYLVPTYETKANITKKAKDNHISEEILLNSNITALNELYKDVLIPYWGATKVDESVFLVGEFVEGGTLAHSLKQNFNDVESFLRNPENAINGNKTLKDVYLNYVSDYGKLYGSIFSSNLMIRDDTLEGGYFYDLHISNLIKIKGNLKIIDYSLENRPTTRDLSHVFTNMLNTLVLFVADEDINKFKSLCSYICDNTSVHESFFDALLNGMSDKYNRNEAEFNNLIEKITNELKRINKEPNSLFQQILQPLDLHRRFLKALNAFKIYCTKPQKVCLSN